MQQETVITPRIPISNLMRKTVNDKSIWGQAKSVFNDGTEIVSETFETGSELVKAFRKSLNLLNLQLDEMIILQKITLVTTLVETGLDQDTAISIIIAQQNN